MHARSLVLMMALLVQSGAAFGSCSRPRPRPPIISRSTHIRMSYSPPKPSILEKNWLQGCAVSWLVVAAPLLLNPSEVALHVFALDVAGTYGVQQPAAGFLQLAATLMPLEAALLQLLASQLLDEAAVETRARLSASVVLAAGGALGACVAAASTGLTVVDPAGLAVVLALCGASAVSVLRPLLREISTDELSALAASDTRSLLGQDTSAPAQRGKSRAILGKSRAIAPAAAADSPLNLFYRSSAIASLVVGGAFALSPISPLAVYEAELPVTYLARALFGVYIALLLSPIQIELYATARRGELGMRSARRLNLLCAASIGLLDGCGNAQVRAQEVLVQGIESLPDTFRFEANTTAAFYTALLVAIVYLVQGLGAQAPPGLSQRRKR